MVPPYASADAWMVNLSGTPAGLSRMLVGVLHVVVRMMPM